MMPDSAIQEALKGLDGVLWRDTAFADLQWYYAEEGVYVLRCKHGEPNEHLCVVRAKSADEAIARAVFDLHKSDEKKKVAPVGNAAALREAVLLCYRIIHCAMVTGVINRDDANEAMDAYHAALAKPPRNCDVGTEREQNERYKQFCREHDYECGLGRSARIRICPAYKSTDCAIAWEQMPYEEKGENNGNK